MANYVYIATSLDGFIADRDGGLDWLMNFPNPGQADYGFEEFLSGIDAIIMGRKTYETVRSFGVWPYRQPVFVLSNTMKAVPEEMADRVKVVGGSLEDIIGQLNSSGLKNLYLDGGISIQGFLREDLVDELIISRIPLLLGGGIPLFGEQDQLLLFDHVKTEIFDNGIVQSHYIRKR